MHALPRRNARPAFMYSVLACMFQAEGRPRHPHQVDDCLRNIRASGHMSSRWEWVVEDIWGWQTDWMQAMAIRPMISRAFQHLSSALRVHSRTLPSLLCARA